MQNKFHTRVITLSLVVGGSPLGGCDQSPGDERHERRAVVAEADDDLVDAESGEDAETEPELVAHPNAGGEPANATPGAGELVVDTPVVEGGLACGDLTVFVAPVFGCEYVRVEEDTLATVRADCDAAAFGGYRVLHGGCYTSSTANLRYSAPDEGTQGNLPSDSDGWNTTDADGWSCRFSAAPGASQEHIAIAMCCPDGSAEVPICT